MCVQLCAYVCVYLFLCVGLCVYLCVYTSRLPSPRGEWPSDIPIYTVTLRQNPPIKSPLRHTTHPQPYAHTHNHTHTHTVISSHRDIYRDTAATQELSGPKHGGGVQAKRAQRWASKGSQKGFQGTQTRGSLTRAQGGLCPGRGQWQGIGPRGGSHQPDYREVKEGFQGEGAECALERGAWHLSVHLLS